MDKNWSITKEEYGLRTKAILVLMAFGMVVSLITGFNIRG
jgi:hypothetical protein